MTGIARSAAAVLQKTLHLLCRYGSIMFYWKLKFFKIRVQRWKQCSAHKRLLRAQSGLGAEIYALYKQSETGWEGMPLVKECLRIVEEAESVVFQVEAAIEKIKDDYAAKVESIKAKHPCSCSAEAGDQAE